MQQDVVQNAPEPDLEIPTFLRRTATPPQPGDDGPEPAAIDELASEDAEAFEDPEPPYRAAQPSPEEVRQQEQELERQASGFTAEEPIGKNGKPLVVGDIAHVTFGVGKTANEKSGTLLAVEGQNARVRLKGSKEPLGELFPLERVATSPINMGRPVKSKAEKKHAAEHADDMSAYREALARGDKSAGDAKPRPSDGFAHAKAAGDDEVAPLPKRILRGHNGGVSEATIYRHLGNIRAKEAAKDKAVADLRNAWKKAKDDGVPEKALKQVMKEMGMSPDEIITEINELNAMRAAVRLPNQGPAELESEQRRDTVEERVRHAKVEGERAGLRGADQSTNPYPDPNDPCAKAWVDGWEVGQKALGARFKKLDS